MPTSAARRVEHPQQLTIFPRGGKRDGAGRRPKGDRARVTHVRRKKLSRHSPVSVTLRLHAGLPSLRTPETLAVLLDSFAEAAGRFELALVQYSVQSNHLHLIVEAHDEIALGRGMKGLTVRIARGLNSAWHRKGKVFADRFHAHVLETPSQVRHALVYVLNNVRKHGIHPIGHADEYSSGESFDGWIDQPPRAMRLASDGRQPCSPARTWLLRVGWRRQGLLYLHEVPSRGLFISRSRSAKAARADRFGAHRLPSSAGLIPDELPWHGVASTG